MTAVISMLLGAGAMSVFVVLAILDLRRERRQAQRREAELQARIAELEATPDLVPERTPTEWLPRHVEIHA